MLELLTIKDFQAHHDLSIDLDPAVTTIVGPSDTGKSAVIRALIWLATNRPLGDSFIRDGTKRARVTLRVDGHEIVRHRSKSLNTYSIDGEELKAFGNDTPEEIANLLNLSPINLQQQHDSPFWFSDTAGEVSRQLNQIVDLSIIDHTMTNLETAKRRTAAEVRTLEQQEETAKVERSDLSWVRKATADILEVEKHEEIHLAAARIHQNAAGMVQAALLAKKKVATLKSGQEAAEEVLRVGSRFEEVRGRGRVLKGLINEVREGSIRRRVGKAANKVLALGLRWEEAAKPVAVLPTLIRKVRSLQAIHKQPVPDITALDQLDLAADEIAVRRTKLHELIGKTRQEQRMVKKFTETAEAAETKFHEQMGEECPLCGKKL